MSKVGPSSGVELVTRMQPSDNLEHAWLMFDHVKRVYGWTSMACYVYDSTYQQVMTIACCDFESKDMDAHMIFWKNINLIMAQHGILNLQFKGLMADSTHANWNAVKIVYGSRDPKVPMEDYKRTCFFH